MEINFGISVDGQYSWPIDEEELRLKLYNRLETAEKSIERGDYAREVRLTNFS